jgi:hypothetical protein
MRQARWRMRQAFWARALAETAGTRSGHAHLAHALAHTSGTRVGAYRASHCGHALAHS